MNKRLQNWIERLANAGSLPSDTAEQRLRKAILIFLVTSYCIIEKFFPLTHLGEVRLKNFKDPVEVYQITIQ